VKHIGKAIAGVLPGFPVNMYCRDRLLRYYHDPKISPTPGVSLPILDGYRDELYGRVCWDGTGKYRLVTPVGELQVEYQEGIYAFGLDNICIAALGPVQKGSPFDLSGKDLPDPDWKPWMAMMTSRELPEELEILILSFPLMRIAP
jgi:hypothetical protein